MIHQAQGIPTIVTTRVTRRIQPPKTPMTASFHSAALMRKMTPTTRQGTALDTTLATSLAWLVLRAARKALTRLRMRALSGIPRNQARL